MSEKKVSAVVPAWNEATRITYVLRVLANSHIIDEIIVVDDGSSDGTANEVKSLIVEFPHKISLIQHKKNQGKTAAVLTGIDSTSGEVIILVDADLLSFTNEHIKALVTPLLENKYDMVILDRRSDKTSIVGWTTLTRLYGGERSFFKKHFLAVDLGKDDRYLIESKLNLHFIKNKLRIKTVYFKDLISSPQFEKLSLFKALNIYIKMFYKIFLYAGVVGIYKMIVNIEDERLSFLYKANRKYKVFGPLILVGIFILGLSAYVDFK